MSFVLLCCNLHPFASIGIHLPKRVFGLALMRVVEGLEEVVGLPRYSDGLRMAVPSGFAFFLIGKLI